MLRLFILHLLIKDSLVVAPNVKLCKVIDKVMSRTLEWIQGIGQLIWVSEQAAKTRHSSLADASADDHRVF